VPHHDLIVALLLKSKKRRRSGEIMARLRKLVGNPFLQCDVFSLFRELSQPNPHAHGGIFCVPNAALAASFKSTYK
jgi:hypothetical protein